MYLSKLRGEFEGGALEAEVVPRWVGQDKPKVYVDDMALRVHQNVTIVPVYPAEKMAKTNKQLTQTM